MRPNLRVNPHRQEIEARAKLRELSEAANDLLQSVQHLIHGGDHPTIGAKMRRQALLLELLDESGISPEDIINLLRELLPKLADIHGAPFDGHTCHRLSDGSVPLIALAEAEFLPCDTHR